MRPATSSRASTRNSTRRWATTPVLLLERLNYDRKEAIVKDKELMRKVHNVYKQFLEYMDEEVNKSRPSVAYFCMEFGLNQVLKIYSGGLGMLAGDYLKEASDSNVDLCGVGLLYRFGYFTQSLSMDGQQIAKYDAQYFNALPIERELDANGNQLVIDIPYRTTRSTPFVRHVNVGRIKLYLLDTDNEMNSEYDRPITHNLYGGDNENRLKQEILLGIGGTLMLKKLGIKKDIYHCNEGHAALCNLQRLCDYIQDGLSFNEAMELVRASSLYTVHTPVPAGHDYFEADLFGKYMGGYPEKLGISWDEFIGMGRINANDHNEKFCMSVFACNTCQEVNGVSKLHGWVSREDVCPRSGRATTPRRTMSATSPTASTSPPGRPRSGASSTTPTSTTTSSTTEQRAHRHAIYDVPDEGRSGRRAWR